MQKNLLVHLLEIIYQIKEFSTLARVDTPQQNRVAEYKNRHLLEVTRCLMFSTHVPKFYWGKLFLLLLI